MPRGVVTVAPDSRRDAHRNLTGRCQQKYFAKSKV
jgi:hypothetical protein